MNSRQKAGSTVNYTCRPDIEGNDQHESELQPSLIEPGPPSHRRGNTKVGEKAQDHAIQLAESDLEKRLLSQGKQAKEEANQGLESLRAPSEPSSTGPSDQNKLEADLPGRMIWNTER